VSDAKVPINNPVLLNAWNDICMVMAVQPDGTYDTRYILNGAADTPNISSPAGTTDQQLYAQLAIIGATTNNAANYTATVGDVNFCTLPLGETLPAVCGGGVA